jgi:hypothetical protein
VLLLGRKAVKGNIQDVGEVHREVLRVIERGDDVESKIVGSSTGGYIQIDKVGLEMLLPIKRRNFG